MKIIFIRILFLYRFSARANFSPPPQMNSTMMSANEEEFLDHEDG